jgi:hypothetical protein
MFEEKLVLDSQARREIVDTKVTCPFLGSAVFQETLSVYGDAVNPLAKIEDVTELGNRGGGDLGNLLALFAAGNHAFMRNESGTALDVPVPEASFSLELPGSQGSHAGHSGILEANPKELDSGRLCIKIFQRLALLAVDDSIKRSDVGRFVAENLKRDPGSNVSGPNAVKSLVEDLGAFLGSLASELINVGGPTATRAVKERFTKLLGADNLVGSAGEFGLLFAFLHRSPRTKNVDGELALSLEDVRGMFLDQRLPEHWDTWKKLRSDWMAHTASLIAIAEDEYRRL